MISTIIAWFFEKRKRELVYIYTTNDLLDISLRHGYAAVDWRGW